MVINDGSTDQTLNILQKNKKLFNKLITYNKNRGKGYACIQGIKKSFGDAILIQDADLEYNPRDYNKIINPIILKKYDAVYGSRVLNKSKVKRPKNFDTIIRVFANFLLTAYSNLVNKQNLTDAHTCYKAVSRKILKKIKLKRKDFAFCVELNCQLSQKKIDILEVPISYCGRTHDEGKKIKLIDGFIAIKLLTMRFFNKF